MVTIGTLIVFLHIGNIERDTQSRCNKLDVFLMKFSSIKFVGCFEITIHQIKIHFIVQLIEVLCFFQQTFWKEKESLPINNIKKWR